jgi:hypothetical protein
VRIAIAELCNDTESYCIFVALFRASFSSLFIPVVTDSEILCPCLPQIVFNILYVIFLIFFGLINLFYRFINRGAQIFQKPRSHLKILGARTATRSKVSTEDPQTLGAEVQNLVTRDGLSPCICTPLVCHMTGNIAALIHPCSHHPTKKNRLI